MRKITQIAVGQKSHTEQVGVGEVTKTTTTSTPDVFALTDDGRVWRAEGDSWEVLEAIPQGDIPAPLASPPGHPDCRVCWPDRHYRAGDDCA